MPKSKNKICKCGTQPCLSHRYKGEYRCAACVTKLNPVLGEELARYAHILTRNKLVTTLLSLEGYPNLRCIKDGQITDGKWYYFVEIAGRYTELLNGELIFSDKWGDLSCRLYRQLAPIKTNVYKMLTVLQSTKVSFDT